MGEQPSAGLRTVAMYAPLVTGCIFGTRLVWLGMRRQLSLGQAIKNAFKLGSSDA